LRQRRPERGRQVAVEHAPNAERGRRVRVRGLRIVAVEPLEHTERDLLERVVGELCVVSERCRRDDELPPLFRERMPRRARARLPSRYGALQPTVRERKRRGLRLDHGLLTAARYDAVPRRKSLRPPARDGRHLQRWEQRRPGVRHQRPKLQLATQLRLNPSLRWSRAAAVRGAAFGVAPRASSDF